MFIYDHIISTPIGVDLGIPHALLLSCAPTYLGYHKLPANQSGLPTEYTEENVKKWESFIDKTYRIGENKRLHDELNEWLKEKNCPANLDDWPGTLCPSPHFNIYKWLSTILSSIEFKFNLDLIQSNYPQTAIPLSLTIRYPAKWNCPVNGWKSNQQVGALTCFVLSNRQYLIHFNFSL